MLQFENVRIMKLFNQYILYYVQDINKDIFINTVNSRSSVT